MVKILVVHGSTDILNAEIIEIHGQDLLAVLAQGLKMLVKQISQVILKKRVIGRAGVVHHQGMLTQFLSPLQVFLPFLDPNVLADCIEERAEFTAQLQLTGSDPLVNDDHGILEYVHGLLPGSLVVGDVPLYDWIVGIVQVL